jgi:alkylation response protein AidB-like acyl-CoA dehydrogenase
MLNEPQAEWKRRGSEFATRELGGEPVEGFDREGWGKCAAFGALAVTVAPAHGGSGCTLADFVALMEGMGYATRRLGLLFALNAQVFGAIEPIRAAGTDAQKDRWLPRLVRGEWVAAHGVTEPGGGSDVRSLTTEASPAGSDWVLRGVKHCITCGAVADLHVVYARTPGGSFGCFVVEPGTPGVSMKPLHPAGLHGCGLGQIAFDGVTVPAGNVVGSPNAGPMLFQGAIERERACIFGFVLGAMERELDLAVRYANERVIGGKPIAEHQAIAHRVADMKVRLEVSRLVLYRAASLKAAGRRAPLEAAMTKLVLSESFLANSLDLVRLYGGNGFLREGGVEHFVRDALGGVLFSGTSDIQRNIIAGCAGLTLG